MYDCNAMPAAACSMPASIQRLHERRGRDAQVAVLFHVQVDELWHFAAVGVSEPRLHRRAIQQFQAIGQDVDRVLAGQRGDLGDRSWRS